MKKSLPLFLFLALLLFASVSACRKPAAETFTDTLPCGSSGEYTWVARVVTGSTGEVRLSQTYRADDTYAMLGAGGVLENAFIGVEPGVAIIRLYYVNPETWNGFNSQALGTAYYELRVYDDLTISLVYSEVEFPSSF